MNTKRIETKYIPEYFNHTCQATIPAAWVAQYAGDYNRRDPRTGRVHMAAKGYGKTEQEAIDNLKRLRSN